MSNDVRGLEDRVVVITGAGSGIGRALAAGFCRDGAMVVGFGRKSADLAATATEYGQGRMSWVAGDVGRRVDVDRLFADAIQRHGRVDVLINNAALYRKRAFLDTTPDDWEEELRVNVVGLAYCCYRALPGMLERGHGRILNVGSYAWRAPIPNSSAYSAAKGAVRALTRAIAAEIDRSRHPDVLVNEFIPGIVRTRMSDHGDDPSSVYPHARRLVELPAAGPHGQTFLRGDQEIEDYGWRARLRRLASKLSARLGRRRP